MNTKLENMDMQTYLGKLESVIADYNTLMPFMSDVEMFYKQRNQFFMVLALVGLTLELEAVRNQILSGSVVLSYDTVNEQLLRLSTPHAFGSSSTPTGDFFALVSHSSNHG